MEGALSYLIVDNPAQLLGDSEMWSLFREILEFRDREMSAIWPDHNWLQGVDIHCVHCAVLYEDRISGMMRITDPGSHTAYGTRSPVFDALEDQETETAQAISKNLIGQIAALPHRLSEFGQLIISKEFRGTRLGVKTQLLRKLIALTVRTASQLGFRGMYALTREEANTLKLYTALDIRYLGGADRLVYKNGCVSRVMICDRFAPSYMNFIATELEEEFTRNARVFSRRLSTRTPTQKPGEVRS